MALLRAAALVACGAATAGAQPDPARALLRQGIADRRAHRDAEALAAFTRAYALSPDVATLAQVGLAEQALGRWVEAERHLIDALAGDDPWVRRHADPLRAALTQVRARLGSLLLEGSPAGAAVRVDDASAGALPSAAPLRVRAGTVVVRVEAPGHHPIERRVEVEAGASVREVFRLVPIAPEAPPPAPAPAPPPPAPRALPPAALAPAAPPLARPRPWAGIVVLGVGAAAIATGATLAALSAADVDALRVRCAPEDDPSTADVECARGRGGEDLQARASLQRDLSVVGFAVGGAAVLAGFVWWWFGGGPARPVALRPLPGGATLGWSF